jgi:type IV protein arginine methyltransferase
MTTETVETNLNSQHADTEAYEFKVTTPQKDDCDCDDDDGTNLDVKVVESILDACQNGNLNDVQEIITKYGTMYGCYALPSTGITPLMVSASVGHLLLVQYLLQDCSAPWNALDRQYLCAGEYATKAEQWEIVNLLVDWATRAELILGSIERENRRERLQSQVDDTIELQSEDNTSSTKPNYFRQRLQYTNDGHHVLMDADRDAVMMEWERPIMKVHAEILMSSSSSSSTPSTDITAATTTTSMKRVLNVGFGLGIIDTILQEYNPSHHIIIEAHPDVYQHMLQHQWQNKTNVRICYGTWQSVLPQLISEGIIVDAIFFDTYGEHYLDMEEFHQQMTHLLAKPHGIYSFFNGLAPDNLFFHGVACQCVKLQLATLGLDSEFLTCDIQAPSNDVWKEIRRKYWHGRETYYLPVCTWNAQYLQTGKHPDTDAIITMTNNTYLKRKLGSTSNIESDMEIDNMKVNEIESSKRQQSSA